MIFFQKKTQIMGNCAGKKVEGQPTIPLGKIGVNTLAQVSSMPQKGQKESLYQEMMDRELNSTINLQAIFFVTLPIKGAYKLDYKMNYSIFESSWTEERLRSKEHKSRPCQFQY